MIATKNLQKLYRAEEVETTALNYVTMTVDEGEFVAVMGPSGCGKSTLLNILGLLDNPTGGEYHFLNQEVSGHSERQRANLRKANIGFVFQSFNLIDELTVYENIELPLIYLGASKAERKDSGWKRPWSTCRSPTGGITSRSNSPAASSSAWPWHGRSSAIPA